MQKSGFVVRRVLTEPGVPGVIERRTARSGVFRRVQNGVDNGNGSGYNLALIVEWEVQRHVAKSAFQNHVAGRRVSPLKLSDPGVLELLGRGHIIDESGAAP